MKVPRTLRIEYLAEEPGVIPEIARWQFEEWGHLLPDDSIDRRIEKLGGHLNRNRIPMTFVALDGFVPVGSASLVKHDLPDRTDLSPWLSSVFVVPGYRRRGIGTALVGWVVDEAYRLRISPLYLFTWEHEGLYGRLGWRTIERTRGVGHEIVIMEIRPGEEAA